MSWSLIVYISSQKQSWENLSGLETFKDNLKQPEGYLGATPGPLDRVRVFIEHLEGAPEHIPVWDAER